ncbi:MAG TPA: hypothetical protein VHS31_07800 [Tepidisphaeraceae bacterium]|jgi:predicted GH43/DUF377 family glycosyl hydrolase|nr:hypothetical protein [Tepidisphaeraceae bacterium]
MDLASQPAPSVAADAMQRIYDEVKTPYKYGVVLKGGPGKDGKNQLVDCPSVFRFNNKWYMVYVSNNDVGYETHLADSDDLLKWNPLGKLLSFQKDGWDKWQADGAISLVDTKWDGSHEPAMFDGRYWMSYIGGALQGYETDPLSIGLAWSKSPDRAEEWNRIEQNPVLGPNDPDTRDYEKATLYKSQIIWDKSETLGHPFVMFYNGKEKTKHHTERIGMAVSMDMVNWSRYGTEPVIDNKKGISGDPQIVRIGDLWVMFYFGFIWKPHAFDTFACSTDLVNWTKWDGANLVEPSEPFDKTFAHKPWVLKHDGVVYHYYCAVGDQGRVIALATSKRMT